MFFRKLRRTLKVVVLDLFVAFVLHFVNIQFTGAQGCQQTVYLILRQYVAHEAHLLMPESNASVYEYMMLLNVTL